MMGFVYSGTLTTAEIQALRQRLGLSTQLSWDLARLDFSKELRDAGTAFSSTCELRWRRQDAERFHALLLADNAVEVLLLERASGEWRTEEITIQLVDLRSPQFAPQFQVYPTLNSPKARLRCRVFYRDSVAMFISPREVISDETA